jgi:hypothetical protein
MRWFNGFATPPDRTHQFWPDEVCLLDPSKVDSSRIHGSRQITDVYLLAVTQTTWPPEGGQACQDNGGRLTAD